MKSMNNSDRLFRLLTDFFNLPPETRVEKITQQDISSWDSLAMVQLIADLQGTFFVEFDLDEIETLRSYNEIRRALRRKGVSIRRQTPFRWYADHKTNRFS
jgi:acyl carrier protein